jgi:DNA-binding transcriptional regulator GbsR (MarR family)
VGDVRAVREEFVQLWGRLGPFWGIGPATARVYAWLLSQADARDADEIGEALQISRGAVSMACRELLDWGLVLVERPAGARRLSYRLEDDLEKVVRAIIQTRKRREWDPILDNIREWQTTLAGDSSRDARQLQARLDTIAGVISLVESFADRFLRGGIVPRVGLKALVRGTNRARRIRERRGTR